MQAQESVNGYHKEEGPGKFAIKVDLMKADDSVDWKLILRCLCACGVSERFVQCVGCLHHFT